MAGTRGRMAQRVRNLSASGISVSSKFNLPFFLIYSRFLFTLTAPPSQINIPLLVSIDHSITKTPAPSRSLGDIELAKVDISSMFMDSVPTAHQTARDLASTAGGYGGSSIRTFLRSRTFAPSIVLRLPAHTRVMVSLRDISHHQLWK